MANPVNGALVDDKSPAVTDGIEMAPLLLRGSNVHAVAPIWTHTFTGENPRHTQREAT